MLLPVEILVGATAILGLVLFAVRGVPLREPLQLYAERVGGGFAWYFLALILAVFFVRLADIRRAKAHGVAISRLASVRRYRSEYLSLRRIFFDLRLVHALGLMFVVFIHLKHLTPILRTTIFDRYLFAAEDIVFRGKLLSERLIAVLGTLPAEFFSGAYSAFFPYMGILLAVMVLERDRRVAQRFAFGFALVWILGAFIIWALPTWGPCFFRPELFSGLPPTAMTELQVELWRGKTYVEAMPRSPAGIFLISGFPSLHIAVCAFGSLCLQKKSPLLGQVSWGFFWLTGITTLYFGWHYVLDDIGGFFLGLSIFRMFVTPRE